MRQGMGDRLDQLLFHIRLLVRPDKLRRLATDPILRWGAVKGECSVFYLFFLLWMKTIHYPNTVRSHLVTIVPMVLFTPKSTSKLRSALHIRYSKVILRFISRANATQT